MTERGGRVAIGCWQSGDKVMLVLAIVVAVWAVKEVTDGVQ